MVICQNEMSGRRQAAVVVSNDAYNHSRIATVVVAGITSNLRLASMPGNVRLAKGEANLPKRSVVNVTQIVTLDKTRVIERIGILSRKRLHEVLDGITRLLQPVE